MRRPPALAALLAGLLVSTPTAWASPPSPFEQAVNQAIDRAVTFLIAEQNEKNRNEHERKDTKKHNKKNRK